MFYYLLETLENWPSFEGFFNWATTNLPRIRGFEVQPYHGEDYFILQLIEKDPRWIFCHITDGHAHYELLPYPATNAMQSERTRLMAIADVPVQDGPQHIAEIYKHLSGKEVICDGPGGELINFAAPIEVDARFLGWLLNTDLVSPEEVAVLLTDTEGPLKLYRNNDCSYMIITRYGINLPHIQLGLADL